MCTIAFLGDPAQKQSKDASQNNITLGDFCTGREARQFERRAKMERSPKATATVEGGGAEGRLELEEPLLGAGEGAFAKSRGWAGEEYFEKPGPPLPPLSLDGLVDDFSLQSQGIRFRAAGREMKVYEQPYGQLILEERCQPLPQNGDSRGGDTTDNEEFNGLLVKTVNDKSYALNFLRATYTLMAIFVAGFLFISGLCILLFLFIDLALTLGTTSTKDMKVIDFIALLLSIPVFIYSMAMGMTLVGRYVVDTFRGYPFLRSFGLGAATTEWIAFLLHIGIPMLAFIITLFSKSPRWWEISLLVWFSSIIIFWCLFSACLLWLEVWACLELMEEDDGTSLIDDDPRRARIQYWLKKAGKACVRTMRHRLTGKYRYFKKMEEGSGIATQVNSKCIDLISVFSEGPYSFFANKEWNPCFVQKSNTKIDNVDEILGSTFYVTRYSWSLEKLFCRSGGIHSAIPITHGESSLTKVQINSNIACNILGNVIVVLLFISFALWFGLPQVVLGITTFIVVLYFLWVGYTTCRLFDLRREIANDKSTALYRYWELHEHSIPKDGFVWTVIFFQVWFLYILPLIFLCINSPNSAIMFSVLGIFSGLKHYWNPRIVLKSSKKGYFRDSLEETMDRKKWRKKSVLYHLVAAGSDKARHFWTVTYLLFAIFMAVVAAWAGKEYHYQNQSGSTMSQSQEPVTLLDDYKYLAKPAMPYPTCEITKGFNGTDIRLQDFAFLSKLAYIDDDSATFFLERWFGTGVAKNDVALIDEFKQSPEYEDFGFGSAVSYKVITFPAINSAALTIRGTKTAWDLIADAQLWLPAILFQGLRFVLPFSELFTPILHHMIYVLSRLESDSLNKVAFYRETRGFVNYLKEVKGLRVVVTGHSLGGGLAIITGAETDANAVAISGPNAMLSRDSFIPPVTVEKLDTFTFNVIPARDPVAMIDDKARLYQLINCTAPVNDIIGCHDITRATCEIQYTCGSADRPVACECVLDFDYPIPEWSGANQTAAAKTDFFQTCVELCRGAGGSSKKCDRWKEKFGS
ncbi:hypothetical protein ACHAWF_016283 [Thalassiosira exigua]